jgi:3-deoxy-D-manno-octulosonate 8-phosphate phosphatase (KDO 8-P phosphatase)
MALAADISPETLEKARPVKLLLLDVDGVLTDGGLTYSESGEQTKRFNTLDGHGLKLLQSIGIHVAVISGRDSAALRKRLSDLGIVHVHAGVHNKRASADLLLQNLGLNWSQVAAMGDDWPDLAMLMPAAFSCAPPQAHAEVLSRVDWVTTQSAGHGAVRELCDLLLQACEMYDDALKKALL